MNSTKGLLAIATLASAITSHASPENIDTKAAMLFNPVALTDMNRAEAERAVRLPSQCWWLGESQYCEMRHGVSFIFDKENRLTSVLYGWLAFSQIRKHGMSERSYEDLSINGKPIDKAEIAIWRKLLSKKPDFKSHTLLIWKDPASHISSVAFTTTNINHRANPTNSANFEAQMITVNFK